MSHWLTLFLNSITAGLDYVSTTIVVTFEPSDESTQTLCGVVPIINDTIPNEPDEQFAVRLIRADPLGNLVGEETCVTIVDDDGKLRRNVFCNNKF